MKKIHSAVLDVGLRVQGFLDANTAAIGDINQSGSRKQLDQAVAALQANAVDQGVSRIGSVGETQNQRDLRSLIRRKFMRPISEVASARLVDVPQFADLHMPPGNLVGARFIAAGRGMAAAALPYVTVLMEAGLPANVIDGLQAALDTLQESVGTRMNHSQGRSLATVSLDEAARRMRRAVRALDGAVRHHLVDQPALLGTWQLEKRYPRRAKTGTDTNT